MAFKFRLETLLKLKRLDESRALERFASSQQALDACDSALDDLRQARATANQEMDGGGQAGCLSALEFELVARQLDILSDRIASVREQRKELSTTLRDCRQNLQAKVSERKGHERIRTREQTRWRKRVRRRQLKRMDEVGARPKNEEVEDE